MTVDTLKIFERLKSRNLPEAAARELAEIIGETSGGIPEEVATKQDVSSSVDPLRKDIEALRASTKQDIAVMTETLRKEMAEMKFDIIKWMVGISVAEFAALVSLLKLAHVL